VPNLPGPRPGARPATGPHQALPGMPWHWQNHAGQARSVARAHEAEGLERRAGAIDLNGPAPPQDRGDLVLGWVGSRMFGDVGGSNGGTNYPSLGSST
jgi:hypothetical protein